MTFPCRELQMDSTYRRKKGGFVSGWSCSHLSTVLQAWNIFSNFIRDPIFPQALQPNQLDNCTFFYLIKNHSYLLVVDCFCSLRIFSHCEWKRLRQTHEFSSGQRAFAVTFSKIRNNGISHGFSLSMWHKIKAAQRVFFYETMAIFLQEARQILFQLEL